MSADKPARSDDYAVTHACSILFSEDAKRRKREPSTKAFIEADQALTALSDDDSGEALQIVNRLLDILGGPRAMSDPTEERLNEIEADPPCATFGEMSALNP